MKTLTQTERLAKQVTYLRQTGMISQREYQIRMNKLGL